MLIVNMAWQKYKKRGKQTKKYYYYDSLNYKISLIINLPSLICKSTQPYNSLPICTKSMPGQTHLIILYSVLLSPIVISILI